MVDKFTPAGLLAYSHIQNERSFLLFLKKALKRDKSVVRDVWALKVCCSRLSGSFFSGPV